MPVTGLQELEQIGDTGHIDGCVVERQPASIPEAQGPAGRQRRDSVSIRSELSSAARPESHTLNPVSAP